MIRFLVQHYDEIIAVLTALILIAEIITNLTPSKKDNSVVLKIKKAFDSVFPNRAKTELPGDEYIHECETNLRPKRRNRKK